MVEKLHNVYSCSEEVADEISLLPSFATSVSSGTMVSDVVRGREG